jgi:hypothetical protein
MRSKQRGMTVIGMVVLAAMVGVLGFAGLKLSPAYLENMKIRRILNDVKTNMDGQHPTSQEIRRAIDKRLDIEMVYGLKARDFLIEKSADGYIVAARYERAESFVANISLLVTFNSEVEIR